MQEQWKFIPGFPNYEISNLGQINRIGKTKKIPVKVFQNKNYVYASLVFAPYKSKQVNIRQLLDTLFDDHIYKDHSLENLEGEVWKDVVGWDYCYEVSNFGRVKTKSRMRNGKSNTLIPISSKSHKIIGLVIRLL